MMRMKPGHRPAHNLRALSFGEFPPATPGELAGTGDCAAGLCQDLPREGRHVCQTTCARVTGLHVGLVQRGGMGRPPTRSEALGSRAPWRGSVDTLHSDLNTGF